MFLKLARDFLNERMSGIARRHLGLPILPVAAADKGKRTHERVKDQGCGLDGNPK